MCRPSGRAAVAAKQSTKALTLDDFAGGGVAARFAIDQLIPQSLVRAFLMEVGAVRSENAAIDTRDAGRRVVTEW